MSDHVADAQLRAWLDEQPPFAGAGDVEALRAGSEERARARPRGPEMTSVSELEADGVPVRLYVPDGDPAALLVYLHGGGWTVGSLQTHDGQCRGFAAGAGVRVLAVGYRLAPEHPWPAAVDDAVAVLRWVADGGLAAATDAPGVDRGALAVGGDSAGGTIAALACLRLRDEAPAAMPVLQLLVYPNTDLTGSSASMAEKAHGWGVDAEMVRWFNRQWVPDESRWADPGVSPLHAPVLSGLPPAIVVTAEHDPLRDEGEAYARRLRDAGVAVTARREPGLVHGFLGLVAISPACASATGRIAADLRVALRR
jgi:acetyl esterase